MKFYYYLYYKFYKIWDYISDPKILSDFKAVISICFFEALIFLSYLYYSETMLQKPKLIIITLIFIIIPNVYIFIFGDNWKKYFAEFDQFPLKKRRKYSIFFWVIIMSIIINFIISLNYFLLN
jgi:magnesium-transporting ATPase (P-type)